MAGKQPPAGAGTFWLYKQHDLLLGPVPYEAIVEQLYSGDIDGSTPICEQGSGLDFKPLGDNPLFFVHLAKANAKLKVEAQHRDVVQTRRRALGLKAVLVTLLALLGLIAIGFGARYLAVNRPWERKVVLPDPIITDELPLIALASRNKAALDDDEGMAYPTSPSGAGAQGAVTPPKAPGTRSRATTSARPRLPAGVGARADRDGLHSHQTWDEDSIQRILAAKKKTLHPCLTAESHRQDDPAWSARIPLEFTVANTGKVSKLWIDHHDYKSESSELHKCMFKVLGGWQFPPYEGEQANVSMVFNVRAR
ncbi:MAG: AgmX/PglI C-terminal domain-containing protein [Myxococcales bacterium]|jgi:hypothetical protein|nr:AgmX/PglI C-terminal domain-containing protein [Myxococcales bacterium]